MTGHWLGNDEFARFNVNQSLSVSHVMYAIGRRDLFAVLKRRSFSGCRGLDRWLASLAWQGMDHRGLGGAGAGGAGHAARRRCARSLHAAGLADSICGIRGGRFGLVASHTLVRASRYGDAVHRRLVLELTGARIAYEDNLAMVDFVRLEQQAAEYLEDHMADQRIATAWPFFDALKRPEFGYVQRPLNLAKRMTGVRVTDLAGLNPKDFDVLVLYSAEWSVKGRLLDMSWFAPWCKRSWIRMSTRRAEEIRAR